MTLQVARQLQIEVIAQREALDFVGTRRLAGLRQDIRAFCKAACERRGRDGTGHRRPIHDPERIGWNRRDDAHAGRGKIDFRATIGKARDKTRIAAEEAAERSLHFLGLR